MHSLNVLQMCVFNAHVIYKSLQGLTEVLSYFNALKERLHKSQNIFLTEYLSLHHRSVPTDSVLGLTDRSIPTRSSASSADPADVELVISTLPLKLNLRLFGIFRLTTPVPPGFTPRSRSSTCSIPRASTLPVGLSTHSALVNSPAIAVLALLLLPYLPLRPQLIQRV